jgi:DNA-binding CsgD family transcriptional regulator
MGTEFNIHFEIFSALMFFAMFWLLFYKLHYQESRTRRILLIICMALYRPLLAVPLPGLLKILFPFMMIAVIALLAGGEKRSAWITAVYFLGATVLVDTIATSVVLGLSDNLTSWGNLAFSDKDLYIYGNLSIYIVLFLAAIFYYLIIRATPQETLDRIPLRVWIILLLIQPAGIAAFYIPLDYLFAQQEAGYNYFLFIGLALLILFILNLVIFYLFVNFASGYSARLLAGELNKTPPVYSPQGSLSPEFIGKYGLTGREAEITVALIQGKSDKEIAVSLNIAVNTVQVHLKNIYRKTGSPGRYALMALVGLGK